VQWSYSYAAIRMGIHICDQNGRFRAILPLPIGQAKGNANRFHVTARTAVPCGSGMKLWLLNFVFYMS
jgi:hypothetical protein